MENYKITLPNCILRELSEIAIVLCCETVTAYNGGNKAKIYTNELQRNMLRWFNGESFNGYEIVKDETVNELIIK